MLASSTCPDKEITVKNDYGMYTDYGNTLVHNLVMVARREGWDWPKMYRHLKLLAKAHPDSAGECMDTVVREQIYQAIGATENFYC